MTVDGFGFVEALQSLQRGPFVDEGEEVVRPKTQRPVEPGYSLFVAAERLQRIADIVLVLGIVRGERVCGKAVRQIFVVAFQAALQETTQLQGISLFRP